ncbi:MAG: fatty acyl-AMP ligase [SAR324 cluster bacterium]|jgi:acyl-CoA synthetase (AMP-forming)/AMP-acid ligase II/acyl carrier protein|nr:fatty acyl-AMP ligase [SAR324 cluster bacterium]|tara:strand:- start:6920 stop:8947 length:2028 start_codon:yes stop_codon:yes gene_type:complete
MKPSNYSHFVEIARQRAVEHPERDCIIFLEDGENKAVGDGTSAAMTYQQNDQAACQVAASLQKRGIKQGERVLVILPNSLEFVKIFYGCLYGGILAVPLSEPAGPQNMAAYLETFLPTLKVSKPSLIIVTSQLADFLRNQLPPELQKVFSGLEIATDQEILADTSAEYSAPEIKAEDTAYLQFTSGSTGTPKGIMIGHSNLMANLEEARKFMQLEEEDGTAVWLPLFHDFGLAAGLMGALYSGGFTVLMTPAHFIRKPLRWLSAMSKFKCAHSYVPPFALDLCLKKISDEELNQLDLSCMVSVTDGSEPVHYLPTKKFNERFSACGLKADVIRPGFGMAEIVIMFSGSKTGLHGLCADRHVLETEGRVKVLGDDAPAADKKMLVNLGSQMDGHEIVIKGPDNQQLPEGEVGELMVSGPSVAQGYYENIQATEEIFRQNIIGKEQPFLATGDTALLWKGELYFAGRIKDIIIIRGRNYYPHDIELVLAGVEELRPGCLMAYASGAEDESEHLAVAVEVRADLLKDPDVFRKYVLTSIDQKIIEIVGKHFQITPSERLYLEPGTIDKTSSGKIKHLRNRKTFAEETFAGLIERVSSSTETEDFDVAENKPSLETELTALFNKVVSLVPELDQPILDCGADSVVIVEFVDQVETKYALSLEIEDDTTLKDIIGQVKLK